MQIRFIRQTILEFIDTLQTVETTSDLHSVIRAEKALPPDYSIGAALSLRPYTEFVDPRISFEKNYAIYIGGTHIGFADSTLKDLVRDIVHEPVQHAGDVYYVDLKRPACCFTATIMRRRTHAEKRLGLTAPEVYLQINKQFAHFTCEALNAAIKRVRR